MTSTKWTVKTAKFQTFLGEFDTMKDAADRVTAYNRSCAANGSDDMACMVKSEDCVVRNDRVYRR